MIVPSELSGASSSERERTRHGSNPGTGGKNLQLLLRDWRGVAHRPDHRPGTRGPRCHDDERPRPGHLGLEDPPHVIVVHSHIGHAGGPAEHRTAAPAGDVFVAELITPSASRPRLNWPQHPIAQTDEMIAITGRDVSSKPADAVALPGI